MYQSKEITKKLYNNLIILVFISISNLSIYYTWNNIKSSYNNNKFKISTPTWNEEFLLPDGSYSVSDIQDYFQHTLKKYEENTDIYKQN